MASYDAERVAAALDARAGELARTRGAARRTSAEDFGSNDEPPVDNHPGDQGSELHEQELDVSTDVVLDEEDRRIAEARQALGDGTYGICKGCGAEIPAARLEAMPEAVRCIDCQRHFEGRHRQQAL